MADPKRGMAGPYARQDEPTQEVQVMPRAGDLAQEHMVEIGKPGLYVTADHFRLGSIYEARRFTTMAEALGAIKLWRDLFSSCHARVWTTGIRWVPHVVD